MTTRRQILFVLIPSLFILTGCVTGGKKAGGKQSGGSTELRKEFIDQAAFRIATDYASRSAGIWGGRTKTAVLGEFADRTGKHIDMQMLRMSIVSELKSRGFPEPVVAGQKAATLLSGFVTAGGTARTTSYKIEVSLKDVTSQEFLWVKGDTIVIKGK